MFIPGPLSYFNKSYYFQHVQRYNYSNSKYLKTADVLNLKVK